MKKNGVAEKSVAHKCGLPLPCTLGKIRKIDEGLKSLRNNVFDHEIVCGGCGRFWITTAQREALNPQHKEHGYHARLFATRSDWMQSDVVKVVLFGQRGVCVDVGTDSRSSTQEAKHDCFFFCMERCVIWYSIAS